MTLCEMPVKELAARLRGSGILLQIGPFVARFQTSVAELAAPIHLLYADFPLVGEGGIVDFQVRVAPPSAVRRFILPRLVVHVDGQEVFAPFARRLALPMLEWSINWCVFSRPHQYLILHTAVVEREGRALLLPGKPGAGKSTLCAALILRGWRLLSDEVALIRPGTDRIVAVPRPVSLKDESIEIIRRFDSQAVLGPSCPETAKGIVAHLRPPADSVARASETAAPAWVVFPRFERGALAELAPVPRGEALLGVGNEAFNYSLLGATAFETLAQQIDACDCYELHYGELDQGLALLARLEPGGSAAAAASTGAAETNP